MRSLAACTLALNCITGLTLPAHADSSISSGNWLTSALAQISSERMQADIATLSSPTYQGRQTGSEQDAASAEYVTKRFGELRLHRSLSSPPQSLTNPLPQREWKQTAPVPMSTIAGDIQINLTFPHSQDSLKGGSDFLPVLDSPSADLRGSIVFVGYGLSDPSQGIDDYAGLDVRDAIVLFLRGKPEQYKGPASHSDKVHLAKQKGARAYLTATGPILSAYEQRRGITGRPSAFYSRTDLSRQLPGAWISTEVAEKILHEGTDGKRTVRALQEEINLTGTSRSTQTGVQVYLRWTSQQTHGTLFNIASLIRGYSADGDQAVLIGAHRDHFGKQAGLLFAGADDNASGTAVLLEVARVLALAPAAPKRSILFLSFSGEEQGLLGSRLYLSQPIVPLPKTIGMINVDHAGAGNGRLTVGVTGFEKNLAQEVGQSAGLADKLDVFGFFPGGDHVPFKEAGVPTITIVSGGVHPHFHQPTDTADKIDPEILRSVAQYVLAFAWQLANTP